MGKEGMQASLAAHTPLEIHLDQGCPDAAPVFGVVMRHPRKGSNWLSFMVLIGALAALPGAAGKSHGNNGKDAPARFKRLDRNNDGWSTRSEWKGSDRSFSMHDRNGDGVIASAEFEPGQPESNAGRQHARLARLDLDGNNRLTRDEWDGDRPGFDALDANNDDSLNRVELVQATESRGSFFRVLDVNGNGTISPNEWKGDKLSFVRLDTNGDRRLLREEFILRSDDLERSFSELGRDTTAALASRNGVETGRGSGSSMTTTMASSAGPSSWV